MNKTLLTLTGLSLAAGASSAMAQNRWQGHDWDPPASHQWHHGDRDNYDNRDSRRDNHDNGRHEGHNRRNEHRRMVYAPRRGVPVHDYVYYPNARAYYAPWNHRWYHRRGNRWVVTQAAPVSINLGNGINISLGATSPVVYDSYVVRHYREY